MYFIYDNIYIGVGLKDGRRGVGGKGDMAVKLKWIA